MAEYKLSNKTEIPDQDKFGYTIVVSFTDKYGQPHNFEQGVGLTEGKVKAEAQEYADEYERGFNETVQEPVPEPEIEEDEQTEPEA